jgi:hypothetical protein
MREMIHKIILIALILLSAITHPEHHVYALYQFAMSHSETVRTAATIIRLISAN